MSFKLFVFNQLISIEGLTDNHKVLSQMERFTHEAIRVILGMLPILDVRVRTHVAKAAVYQHPPG